MPSILRLIVGKAMGILLLMLFPTTSVVQVEQLAGYVCVFGQQPLN